jgi:hypothetical protein
LSGRGAEALGLVGVVPAEAELGGATQVPGHGVTALAMELDRDALDDPNELGRCVRAHSDLLLTAVERWPVVPVRFGTLFPGPAEIRRWLDRNQEALLGELERLRDAAEWTLTIRESDTRGAGVAPERSSGAETYLERLWAEGEAEARRRQVLAERAEEWHERLSAVAEDAVRVPASADSALLDGAYLVRSSQRPSFDAAAAEIQAELPDLGLESRLIGPWPAFSFVGDSLR